MRNIPEILTLANIRSLSLSLYRKGKCCNRREPSDFTKDAWKSLNQSFLESVHVPRVFFTRSSMILLCWAALQKSHGVKDIAMRHRGVLRSSVREVGYLVVSSPSTCNTFHADSILVYGKKRNKHVALICILGK